LYFILYSPSLRPSQKWQTRMRIATRLQGNRPKFLSCKSRAPRVIVAPIPKVPPVFPYEAGSSLY